MQNYRVVGRMGEGTFSEVLRCQSQVDGKLYACKKMKQKYDSVEQVNGLREIQALRRLNSHPNIIELKDVIFDRRTGTLSLICELMDMNIYELIKDRKSFLPEQKVRMFMYQLLKSVYHMHKNGIFHRDVKPENILVKENVLKLADFGSCKSVYSKQPYTEYISTRWYRAPECLLTDGYYTHKMDMWSVGCVMFEVMTLRPLFPGSNELDQVHKIHDVVGSPSTSLLNKFKKYQSRHMEFSFPPAQGSGISPLLRHGSRGCIDLISQLCTYDPDSRITAKQALRHPYFKDIRDAERRAKSLMSSPPLSREVAGNKLLPSISGQYVARQRRHGPGQLHRNRNKLLRNQEPTGVPSLQSSIAPVTLAATHKHEASSNHFLPSIHASKPGYQSHLPSALPSGYTSMAMSTKSTAHGSFLPSLYGDKLSAKHALYPGMISKHHHHMAPPTHKTHPSHLPSISKHRTGAG